MRSCWNWQTGMTKDHVSLRRVGSSPILRIHGVATGKPVTTLFLLSYKPSHPTKQKAFCACTEKAFCFVGYVAPATNDEPASAGEELARAVNRVVEAKLKK